MSQGDGICKKRSKNPEAYGRPDGGVDIEISYKDERYRFPDWAFENFAVNLGTDLEVYIAPANCAKQAVLFVEALAKLGWTVVPPVLPDISDKPRQAPIIASGHTENSPPAG